MQAGSGATEVQGGAHFLLLAGRAGGGFGNH